MKRFIAVTAALILLTATPLRSQEFDLQQFIEETQVQEHGENAFRLVWWIPTEYWIESFRNVPAMSQEQKTEFYQAVDDYIVLSIIDAKTTAFGSIVPATREEILGKLSLSIDQDKRLGPLKDTDVSSDARNIFAMMKPVMANMLGQFGQGMEFVCFRGTDADGNKLLSPGEKGSFSVHLGDSTYNWRLPLGSLLPARYDPQTGEQFPGNYLYSPFTGNTLRTTPPEKPAHDSGDEQ